MDYKKLLAGTLIGGITFFLLGYLIYGIALASFFEANAGSAKGAGRNVPIFWALFLGNLSMAKLLTYIFARWAGIKTFAGGAKAGALIGALMAASYNFIGYATLNIMNLTAYMVDIVVMAIMIAIVGGVIGAVLGRMDKR